MGAEWIRAGRRPDRQKTDRRTYITKLIGAFHGYANVPKIFRLRNMSVHFRMTRQKNYVLVTVKQNLGVLCRNKT